MNSEPSERTKILGELVVMFRDWEDMLSIGYSKTDVQLKTIGPHPADCEQIETLLRECDEYERLYLEDDSVLNAHNMLLVCVNRGAIYNDITQLYPEAIAVYELGIDIGERLLSDGDLLPEAEGELAKAYMGRGVAYEYLKSYEKSLSDKTKSIEMLERILQEGHLVDENTLALAYMNRGRTYESTHEYDMSIADTEKSIAIWERMKEAGKEVSTNYAKALSNISITRTKKMTDKNSLSQPPDVGKDLTDQHMRAAILGNRKKYNGGQNNG